MWVNYKVWNFHGEREVPFVPEQLEATETVQVADNLSTHPRLDDLINDAYGVHDIQDNHSMECDGGQGGQDCFAPHLGGGVNEDKEYAKLKIDAARPLYPNCNPDHSTLYAMVGLHNLKSHFGLSGNSVTEILKWAKDLLPKDNTLPDNYPYMKKSLKGLGMKYKSIHACKFDCILYRKEYEFLEKCPICGEPRFTMMKTPNDKPCKFQNFSRVPQKVLKYFPLGPRLKRLYTVPWISEALTWHARAEVGGNLMCHPIDSTIWQAANFAHPEFVKEPRNIRLGLSTDGFNPFGNLSTNQSVWPVVLVPYNLPPSLCMRKEFTMLSLLIPGPKAPSDDIDVFLAPLIEELKELWVDGVRAFDSNKKEEFTLKAMLLWAIHDLPAYGTLSGCNVHGYFGCPICGEETESQWLDKSNKICYHAHRRFLPSAHPFRFDKNNFLPDGIEHRLAPKRLSGSESEDKATAAIVGAYYKGKHPKFASKKRKAGEDPKDSSKMKVWSRRSMLFDLPYWKEHRVRHVIDVMHAEKNIVEHLFSTCLDGTHSKDGEKARQDLKLMRVKKNLWFRNDEKTGRTLIPAGAFSLTALERKHLLDTLYELKVPTNYSSNLRRVVNYATQELKQCKSHDWHVIMQLIPLLFKHCFSEFKDLRKAIMQISLCFTLLCAKVVNRKHIVAAKATMVEAICVLEKYFPPSFFDISIHLMVHLCDEALMCGPVRYRWMYPFERLMKTFKDYVKNTRYIGRSISEEYIIEEAALFAREYMPNPGIGSFNPRREQFIEEFDEFADEECLGKDKHVKLTNLQYEQVARYVFETQDDVDQWREKYNASGQSRKRQGVANTSSDFRLWVANELLKIKDATSRLARLAKGPSFHAKEYGKYRVNGFVFSYYPREQNLIGKQNSGISIDVVTSCVASRSDRNPKEAIMTYYGVIQQILELDYNSFKEVVFYCDWVKLEDITNACKVDPITNMVMVDLTKMKSKDHIIDEPFVCAFQNVKQVFYSKYIDNGNWSVVLHSPKRLTTHADALNAPMEFQSALDDNPKLKDFLVNLDE